MHLFRPESNIYCVLKGRTTTNSTRCAGLLRIAPIGAKNKKTQLSNQCNK
jgi:hypothetical protein